MLIRSCSRSRIVAGSALLAALVAAQAPASAAPPASAAAAARPASAPAGDVWVLGTGSPAAAAAAPAYVGNGYAGIRIPASGAGFVDAPVATETHISGVYADVTDLAHGTPQPQGAVNLPEWSTLDFSDGTATYGLQSGTVRAYRQQLDLRDGTVTTSVTWVSPAGRVTDLRYVVLLDRAFMRLGSVTLSVRPHWSGTARVTDVLGQGFDYHPPNISAGLDPGTQSASAATRSAQLTVRTKGTGITVGYADRFDPPAASAVAASTASHLTQLSATFPVSAGRWYATGKTVGMATSLDASAPLSEAVRAVSAAGSAAALRAQDAVAWAQLWRSDILVPGDALLQARIHAAEFYLMSSVRAPGGGLAAWSLSPVGLSSGGYNNHVFWDAETWMYPALLAQHPDLATSIVDYRYRTLPGARANAAATGYAGARFAWESALTGVEVTPPWAETGRLEQHITADVALAQWQYFLATGDRQWLASHGWPVLSGAAQFWASRATRNAQGGYSITGVEGPDEQHFPVDDSVYTNAAAKTTLELAAQAASVVGAPVPVQWSEVARGLVVLPDAPAGGLCCVRPEFQGYAGDQVKQADTVMLTYPWQYPQSSTVDSSDLDYYATRYDPDGPAMTDSVNSIVSAQVQASGCDDWTYTQRSLLPFAVAPYQQFTEARSGQGVFTFLTGEGGFLQEFLYGYSGLRWRSGGLYLAPTLPPQLAGGLRLHGLRWQGRVLDVSIGPDTTTVSLRSGAALAVSTPGGTRTVAPGASLRLPTARPDRGSADLALCRPATATSADASYPAAGAVDGSTVTSWQPAGLPATLTVALARPLRGGSVTLLWAGAGSAAYRLQARSGGRWISLGEGQATPGTTTTLPGSAAGADAVRVSMLSGDATVRLAELRAG